jgi:hypothetical protein
MASRIPQTDDPFNTYINSTADALAEGTPTTAVRLGLTAAQAAAWGTYRIDWNTQYARYGNESTRTKGVTASKNKVRKDFTAFASPLLTAMSVHLALTEDDRLTFRLPEPDRTPTARAEIMVTPVGELHPLVGGKMQVRVRVSGDASRASRHPWADHVEMRYALIAPGAEAPTPPAGPSAPAPPVTGGAGATQPPVTAADCPLSAISTKAIFTITLGQEHSGKRMYAFFRWVNASNSALSGTWSNVIQMLVL